MNKKGFSLVELLIVIAIISIIAGVSTPLFLAARDKARVGEVSAQLAADLERARSSSRRGNQNASVSWTSSSKYSLTVAGKTTERTVPTGIVVTLPSTTTVEYSAPFGEVTTLMNPSFTIALSGKPDIYETVKVFGVTGKVYRQ